MFSVAPRRLLRVASTSSSHQEDPVGTFLISLGIILAAAWTVRRLLGIERGRWPATLGAAFVGELATIGILQAVTGHAVELGWRWYPIGFALVATLSMLALTLVEIVSRPGSRRWSSVLLHPVTSFRRQTGRQVRYAQISALAVRNGLLGRGGGEVADGEVQGPRLGRALASTFEDAGGLFVKLAQAMAAQPQLVGAAVAAEMERLQDRAAPADPAAALQVVREEIGDPATVFAAFAEEPIGAASIAQTYFATLQDGRDVVVKVQRPGIAPSIERDLDILLRLVDRLDRRTDWARSLGLKELATGFAEATREELDFRIEAVSGTAARASLEPSDPITVPEVFDGYTTRRVLVQERVDGRSTGTPGVLAALDADRRTVLADGLLALVMRQMIGGERFHADPHPGNVFLRSDGRLALIDFGSVGRLNRFERAGVVDMFRALQSEEPALLRSAALRIGTPTARVDAEALDRDLARLLSRAVTPSGVLDPNVFGHLLAIFREFGIVLPRSTTTLFRTLITLLRTLEVIAPGYPVVAAVRRVGGDLVNPLRHAGSVRELVEHEVLSQAPVLSRLPRDVDDVARSLLRGDLRTRISLLSEPEDVRVVTGLVNRLLLGGIGSALALASAVMLTVPVRTSAGSLSLVAIAGGIGLCFSVLLLLRLVVQVLRERT